MLATDTNWKQLNLFKNDVTIDTFRNSPPTINKLEFYTINKDTYILDNVRRKYLQEEIVEKYLVGKFMNLRNEFFQVGSYNL